MNQRLTPLVVAVAAVTEILPAQSAPPSPATGRVVFAHVSVVNVGTGAVRADQTVVTNGERIVSVSPTVVTRLVPGTHVVDGTGKYLIPGLWTLTCTCRISERAYYRSLSPTA